MIVGVVKETYPGERRVALVPAVVPSLVTAGMEVAVEAGAGGSADQHEAKEPSQMKRNTRWPSQEDAQ